MQVMQMEQKQQMIKKKKAEVEVLEDATDDLWEEENAEKEEE
ncbi:MAG TPA: hypothetical protein VJI13_01080 [Candidatus Norongarragalinales archaeon]|nr:hypothetical protein [Candidatus Norongarragalinales archaeon]